MTAQPATSPAAVKLYEALAANPQSSTADLMQISGVSRSAAYAQLNKWETEGVAKRGPAADGRGQAWSLTDVEPEVADEAPAAEVAPEPEQAPEAVSEVPAQRGAAPAARPVGAVGKGGLVVLGRGGLRAEVVDWLVGNSGEITPAKLGKALGGRSSGAVQKTLAKLTDEGVAEITSEKPKAYRRVTV